MAADFLYQFAHIEHCGGKCQYCLGNIVVNKGNVFLSGEAYGSGGSIQSSNLIHISLKFMTNLLCVINNGNPIKQS